ncbi:MAG: hypothetical protein Q4A72_07565 [Bacillota bacterium]|nr:hypothetical protein [Bacillota bacterium]
MRLRVNVKQAGKRRPAVREEVLEVSEGIATLRDLICDVTERRVKAWNQRTEEDEILRVLNAEQTKAGAGVGKFTFGEPMNRARQDAERAVENALQSFEDGLYCVFIGEEQIEDLEASISLTEESVLTFVRLTMLSGRMW